VNNKDDYGIVNMLHHELGRSSGDADPGQEEQAANTLGMFAYKHLRQEPDCVTFLVAHHLVHGQTELDTDKVSPVSTQRNPVNGTTTGAGFHFLLVRDVANATYRTLFRPTKGLANINNT